MARRESVFDMVSGMVAKDLEPLKRHLTKKARREWAEQKVEGLEFIGHFNGADVPICESKDVIAALQAEHARAVRIVKKKIRSLEACIASDKRDGNEAGATLHVYALSILNSTLADMQKGRA